MSLHAYSTGPRLALGTTPVWQERLKWGQGPVLSSAVSSLSDALYEWLGYKKHNGIDSKVLGATCSNVEQLV